MEDQVNLFVPPDRVQRTSSRRWPTLFWVTLKILSVFHHEDLVTERKCYSCKLKDLSERRRVDVDVVEEELDFNCLLLMYESDSKRTKKDRNGNNNRQLCEVCDTMWWNFHGKSERYTAKEIGACFWNHKGSGVLASCVLLLTIAALVYETSFYVSVMWAKPEQTLSLLNRFTIFVLLISHSVLCLSSKLRSMLRSAVPYLSWASTLNARYITRRAQILDLPRKDYVLELWCTGNFRHVRNFKDLKEFSNFERGMCQHLDAFGCILVVTTCCLTCKWWRATSGFYLASTVTLLKDF